MQYEGLFWADEVAPPPPPPGPEFGGGGIFFAPVLGAQRALRQVLHVLQGCLELPRKRGNDVELLPIPAKKPEEVA